MTESNMQSEIALLKEQIEILKSVADQKKLAAVLNTGNVTPRVKVALYDDCVVTSWKTVRDFVDFTGKTDVEDQIMQITYQQPVASKEGEVKLTEKKQEMRLVDFYKLLGSVHCDVDQVSVDKKNDKIWWEFTYKGEPYRIEQTFINK